MGDYRKKGMEYGWRMNEKKLRKKICFIYGQVACDRLTLPHITISNSEQNTKNKYLKAMESEQRQANSER